MNMTSKERVRAAMRREPTDRVPAAYEAVPNARKKLFDKYGFKNNDEFIEKFAIDIVYADARYIGPELPVIENEDGSKEFTSFWGYRSKRHNVGEESYNITSYYPLNDVETVEDVENYNWPSPDWFDYSSIKNICEKYPDKAITIGHPGPFQMATNLIDMDNLFVLMVEEPEVAQRIFDKMVDFEMEYYKRCFEAGEGKVDVLRPHDDYGTQISLLFSVDMWREFFKENTKRLVELTHSYGAFYQQHSCGAVEPIIPELIECGVDCLEPIQKVPCLDADSLVEKYGGKITFHGGIDTQGVLPNGTPDEVAKETERFIQTLGKTNGYILMASQSFETDVTAENMAAVYFVDRKVVK